MILYTMMPEELIFQQQQDAVPKERKIISKEGVSMEVESSGDGFQIVRLLSTDPVHYMDARWLPGSKISL
ncbi:ribonuclease [Neobacillus piezotolerans]|uniref:Ribonuclease n=1 Tax=Neobacillus piezotolerans TaxID=2259171 RepID=A0A3D8GVW5_9BACI|nr:YlzJ-like family protein [Neobacillus piezotolerans]RDU38604.1 ribonuclease [Neobacillus piezotolerans]